MLTDGATRRLHQTKMNQVCVQSQDTWTLPENNSKLNHEQLNKYDPIIEHILQQVCNSVSFLQVAYQRILQLSYIDKLLTDIQLEFRDKYKDKLELGTAQSCDFTEDFMRILKNAEDESRNKKKVMRDFKTSKKAEKIMKNKGILEIKEDKKPKNKDVAKDTVKTTPKQNGQGQ